MNRSVGILGVASAAAIAMAGAAFGTAFGRALAGAALGVLLSGCRACDDKPYVPYSIDSEVAPPPSSSASTAAADAPASVDAGPPQRQAVRAPPATSRWTLEGTEWVSPEGTNFSQALVDDFDGDGKKDAFAIVVRDEQDIGQVVFFNGRTSPVAAEVLKVPVELAPVGTCESIPRLTEIGRANVLVELGVRCGASVARTGPSRLLAVYGVGKQIANRFFATVNDPVGAPSLSFDGEARDFDGDNIFDLSLRVTLEGGGPPIEPLPKVSVGLRWLDRPAGLSSDAANFEQSFLLLANMAQQRSTRAKDAASVVPLVSAGRSLFAAVCGSGGGARVLAKSGPLAGTCTKSRALEELDLAEVRAYATLSDGLRAALALDEGASSPGTHTPARLKDARSWIEQIAAPVSVRSSRIAAAVPAIPKGKTPVWGTLAFEPNGALLIRTTVGVVRVNPEHGDEVLAPDIQWTPQVRSPDGSATWIESYNPCDGVALRSTFAVGEGDMRDVALPISPTLGSRCSGARGELVTSLPLAWGASGLEALVGGEPILIATNLSRASPLAAPLGQPSSRGAPRSANGKWLVVPSSIGLVVRGSKTAIYRAPELEKTYASLRDCAISDDASRLACVRGTQVWVGQWDPL